MTHMPAELAGIRNLVDEIDDQLVRLLKQRLRLAQQMGQLKKKAGAPLQDVAREQHILLRVAELNATEQPLLPQEDLKNVFQTIMHWSLQAQTDDTAKR